MLFLLIVLVLAPAFLFANGSKEASGAAAGSAHLRFMWWGDPIRDKATVAMVDAFEKTHPNITISTEPNPYTGYHDKIIIQLTSGSAPDVICFSTQWTSEVAYGAKPLLYDLNDLKDVVNLSTFQKSLLDGGVVNGHLLGLPTGISGWAFFYNTKVLNEFAAKSGAGLPPGPGKDWTIDQFIAYAQKFHQTMGNDYTFLAMSSDQVTYPFLSFLSEYAGKFYITPDAKINFTKADLVKTLELFKRFTDAGVYGSPASQLAAMTASDSNAAVASGHTPVIFDWTSTIAQNEGVAGSPMAIMAYPEVGAKTHDGIFIRPAQFWSIAASTKYPKQAGEFLNYMVNDPTAIQALGLVRSVPPTEAGQKVLADLGQLKGSIYTGTLYMMKEASAAYNPFILLPEIQEALRTEYSHYISGDKSADQAATDMIAKFQQVLAQKRQQYKIN